MIALGFLTASLAAAAAGLIQLRSRQLGPAQVASELEELELNRRPGLYDDPASWDRLAARAASAPRDEILTPAPSSSPMDAVSEWRQMSGAERARVRAARERWDGMPDAERDRLRANYVRFAALAPEKRRAVLRGYDLEHRDGSPAR